MTTLSTADPSLSSAKDPAKQNAALQGIYNEHLLAGQLQFFMTTRDMDLTSTEALAAYDKYCLDPALDPRSHHLVRLNLKDSRDEGATLFASLLASWNAKHKSSYTLADVCMSQSSAYHIPASKQGIAYAHLGWTEEGIDKADVGVFLVFKDGSSGVRNLTLKTSTKGYGFGQLDRIDAEPLVTQCNLPATMIPSFIKVTGIKGGMDSAKHWKNTLGDDYQPFVDNLNANKPEMLKKLIAGSGFFEAHVLVSIRRVGDRNVYQINTVDDLMTKLMALDWQLTTQARGTAMWLGPNRVLSLQRKGANKTDKNAHQLQFKICSWDILSLI